MVMPTVSRLFWNDTSSLPPKEMYLNMNSDIARRNLSRISEFVGSCVLKSSRKGEIEPKVLGWYRCVRSTPRFDTAAVDRTYQVVLQIKSQPEKEELYAKMKANFEASLKGLERMISYYTSKDPLKALELKEIQTRVLTTLAEQAVPEVQINLENPIAITVENHTPAPPPQPAMERIMPKKIEFKRRPQSVCLDHVDLEHDFMNELFAKIKIKSPFKNAETKEEVREEAEWDTPPQVQTPAPENPMSASMMRSGLQRTVSYYDKRTPLYMPPKKEQDMNLIRSAVAARRLSMRGKGFVD